MFHVKQLLKVKGDTLMTKNEAQLKQELRNFHGTET